MSRKITRSRKGVVFFLPILAVIVLVGMTYGLIVIQNKQEIPSRTGAIGQNPLEVVMKIQEGEKAMIFMDTASRFALYQALYDLQETGGLAEGSECGEYYGFNLWNGPGDQDCSADIDTVEESLRDLFTVNIIARAAAYPDADFVGQLPGMAVERGELVVSEGAAAVDLPEEVGAEGAPPGTETGAAPATAGSVGDKVIIYLPPNTGTSPDLAFRARANAMAQRIGARTYPATNGQEILDAIRRHEQIGVLIIAGHGSSRDFLRPSRAGIRVGPDALSTWVSVDTFAQELAPRLAPGAIISLAGCSAAASPGEPDTPDQRVGPGGERGFAAMLRDAIASQPRFPTGVEIRAHSKPGHATGNPMARTFRVTASETGRPGASLCDVYWGDCKGQRLGTLWWNVMSAEGIIEWWPEFWMTGESLQTPPNVEEARAYRAANRG